MTIFFFIVILRANFFPKYLLQVFYIYLCKWLICFKFRDCNIVLMLTDIKLCLCLIIFNSSFSSSDSFHSVDRISSVKFVSYFMVLFLGKYFIRLRRLTLICSNSSIPASICMKNLIYFRHLTTNNLIKFYMLLSSKSSSISSF